MCTCGCENKAFVDPSKERLQYMRLEEMNDGKDYFLVVQLDGGGAAFQMSKKCRAKELIHHLEMITHSLRKGMIDRSR